MIHHTVLRAHLSRNGFSPRNISGTSTRTCKVGVSKSNVDKSVKRWTTSGPTSPSTSPSPPSPPPPSTTNQDDPTKLKSRQQVQEMRLRMRVIHAKAEEVEEMPQSSLSRAQSQQWDSLWQDGITPWDLGRSTPALISELDRHYSNSGLSLQSDHPRPRPRHCFIPGCGSGYDLVALARYFQKNRTTRTKSPLPSQLDLFQNKNLVEQSSSEEIVLVGLEISPASLDRAQQVVLRWLASDDSTSDSSRSETTSSVSCRIELYQGDFFESPSKWQCILTTKDNDKNDNALSSSSSSSRPLHYDFIFDYLFFCAIPPELRPHWGQQMAQLLTKQERTTHPNDQPDNCSVQQGTHHFSGQLFTLMFPYASSSSSSSSLAHQPPLSPGPQKSKPQWTGPPYPVTLKEYRKVLEPHGVLFQGGKEPTTSPDTFLERQGQERVGWWSFQG
jgi:Thiopurine S-methyltransferase (TPMT)